MGQARARGTFEQRKAESEFYASEQIRYNEWLYCNTRKPKSGTEQKVRKNGRAAESVSVLTAVRILLLSSNWK